MQKQVQTFLHKHYVHTLCVLGLDLGTLPRGTKVCCCFLMSKACHGRWPAVTRCGGELSRTAAFVTSSSSFPKVHFRIWRILTGIRALDLLPFLIPLSWFLRSRLLWCHYLATAAGPAIPECFLRFLDRSSKAWHHHLDMKHLKSAVQPVSVMSYPALQCGKYPMLLLQDQIFDSRRPLVAPIEARSLGSLALKRKGVDYTHTHTQNPPDDLIFSL